MGKINSRAKGARGEVELAHFLTDHGFAAERGQQHAGAPDAPDVKCPRLTAAGFHVECKRVEALQLYPALEQAQRDAGPMAVGVVMHRRNGKDWAAIMPAEFFLNLVEGVEK